MMPDRTQLGGIRPRGIEPSGVLQTGGFFSVVTSIRKARP
jgi:hypothetical protein